MTIPHPVCPEQLEMIGPLQLCIQPSCSRLISPCRPLMKLVMNLWIQRIITKRVCLQWFSSCTCLGAEDEVLCSHKMEPFDKIDGANAWMTSIHVDQATVQFLPRLFPSQKNCYNYFETEMKAILPLQSFSNHFHKQFWRMLPVQLPGQLLHRNCMCFL